MAGSVLPIPIHPRSLKSNNINTKGKLRKNSHQGTSFEDKLWLMTRSKNGLFPCKNSPYLIRPCVLPHVSVAHLIFGLTCGHILKGPEINGVGDIASGFLTKFVVKPLLNGLMLLYTITFSFSKT